MSIPPLPAQPDSLLSKAHIELSRPTAATMKLVAPEGETAATSFDDATAPLANAVPTANAPSNQGRRGLTAGL
jgi:hypothetical protein